MISKELSMKMIAQNTAFGGVQGERTATDRFEYPAPEGSEGNFTR
jgi:hypothetical protein